MRADLITHMGSDITVVNAARVSFDKHKKGPVPDEDDRKLIRYLAKHEHWTPFAHPQAQFRITAPIYIANQLKRHQIGFALNEVSRRYVNDEPTFYRIHNWRRKPAGNAKQGSSGLLSVEEAQAAIELEIEVVNHAVNAYNGMIGLGVAPEQARSILPQSMNTSWYWTGSLAAWARLCKQRLDTHAQEETRELAKDISTDMYNLFPVSWSVLVLEDEG